MKFDVLILGGGIAGSIMAISLKRKSPTLSILIVEKSSQFPFKVGESTSEMTGLFLNRFNIDSILKKHVQKTGLRFTYNEKNAEDLTETNEFSSPASKNIANGYHLNRQQLDEDLLQEAIRLGVEIKRPAEIISFDFEKFNSKVIIKHIDETIEIRASWVVDASGTERIVGKKLNWKNNSVEFNTAASLAHFENIKPNKEWDNLDTKHWDNAIGPKTQSTIHFLRHGCWWWHIVLNNQTTSLGVVYDKSIHTTEDSEKFFIDFIENDASLKYITENATRGPIRHLNNLPYLSKQLYDEGVVVIGDSAAFVDPLFSPGIEFTCQQSIQLCDLISEYFLTNKMNRRKWEKYEKEFLKSFSDRLKIYQDKYKVMESYDIFSNWVQLDFFGYFTFTIYPAVIFKSRMKNPSKFIFPSNILYKILSKRYIKIAEKRRIQGRTSSSLKKPVTYSHVGIPKGYRILYKIPLLFFIWFFNYIRIEKTELMYSLFKNKK